MLWSDWLYAHNVKGMGFRHRGDPAMLPRLPLHSHVVNGSPIELHSCLRARATRLYPHHFHYPFTVQMIGPQGWTWNLCLLIERSNRQAHAANSKQERAHVRLDEFQNASPYSTYTYIRSTVIRSQASLVHVPGCDFLFRLTPPGITRRMNSYVSAVSLWPEVPTSFNWSTLALQSFHVNLDLNHRVYPRNHFNLLFKCALISLALSHSRWASLSGAHSDTRTFDWSSGFRLIDKLNLRLC